MNRDELEALLFQAAVDRAAEAGRQLGEGADHDLRFLVANAASHLGQISDETKQKVEFEQAKSDLRRLIDDAVANARSLSDYPENLLGERTYFPARARFCPCRPFC